MRYREEQMIDGMPMAKHANNDIFAATGFIGLVIGIVLVVLSVRGKQYWLTLWAGGLALFSLVFIVLMIKLLL